VSGQGIGPEDSTPTSEEEALALRWRKTILRLSEAFMDAADERTDLSPFLLEALHNALDNLLVYGDADDLLAIEEWLSMEEESESAGRRREQRASERRALERRAAQADVATEQRGGSDRRKRERRSRSTGN
jgi:hypothetical protein